MSARTRENGLVALAALSATALALCLLAASASALTPLPRSDYAVRAACSAPSPGQASCLALQLVPRSVEARAHTHPLGVGSPTARPAASASPSASAAEGSFGLTPSDLHTAYQLPSTTSSAQTIALVDAYNDPTAESDLKVYDEALGLPPCTSANGCFKKVNQRGEAGALTLPFPKTSVELTAFEHGTGAQREEAAEAVGWGAEISLDIETAHAICHNCKVLLVEANSSTFEDLESAERAAELEAHEISNSWGGPEAGNTPAAESAGAFNHPGTVITAAAGDSGYLEWAAGEPSGEASFPASSPHVIAVGGTHLTLGPSGPSWQAESVWNDGGISSLGVKEGYGAGGGGCSTIFRAPLWQRSVSDWAAVGCGETRAVADIAADADPYTGVAVYDSSRECETTANGVIVHWCTYGGTSLASPIIAASYALAGGSPGVEYPASVLYRNATAHPASLHDVSAGSNGECRKPFDRVSGLTGCTVGEEGASCSAQAICLARVGYDGPSGLGTPDGIGAFEGPGSGPEAPASEAAAAGEGPPPPSASAPSTPAPGASGTAPPGSAPLGPGPAPSSPGAPPTPKISLLGLTRRASTALAHRWPSLAQVGFAFTINTSARVRASLAKRARRHGHTSWHAMRGSLTLSASRGHNRGRLSGRSGLAAGLYRLTLQPLAGAARSILIRIA
ncbi:MAG TPA: S8 family serine peptidase [Solirubrobacteraceae bacterium]|jgi:hypothetical protein